MGGRKTKVSVVIPALKEERYIKKLLTRLLELKPKPEVIVVVSGRRDRTAEIARRYIDKVFVIDRYGISVARNYGAKRAEGDILLFLDADVTPSEKTIETLVRVFRDKEVVGATCTIMPYKADFKENAFFLFYNLLLRLITFFKPHSRGEFLAVRRELFFRIGGFKEDIHCIEDHDLAMRISRLGRFVFLTDLTVYESMRRFRKLGFLNVIKSWIINYFSYLANGRPLYNSWRPIR